MGNSQWANTELRGGRNKSGVTFSYSKSVNNWDQRGVTLGLSTTEVGVKELSIASGKTQLPWVGRILISDLDICDLVIDYIVGTKQAKIWAYWETWVKLASNRKKEVQSKLAYIPNCKQKYLYRGKINKTADRVFVLPMAHQGSILRAVYGHQAYQEWSLSIAMSEIAKNKLKS